MRSLLLSLPLLAAVGCGSASPTESAGVAPTPRPRPTPAPTPKAPDPIPPAPEPPKKVRPSFDADWEAAKAILADRRKGWEDRAAKAKRLLTGSELIAVEKAMLGAVQQPRLMGEHEAGVLVRHGLGDAAKAISGEWAMKDAGFRALSRVVWRPADSPTVIADRAERWGQIREDRREFVELAVRTGAKAADIDPVVRDAMLQAGLRSWLER